MSNTALLELGFLLLALLSGYIGYQTFFSPLSKIPASHWSSRFSPIWSLWVRYTGTELAHLVKAHEKYGPIVQIGPKDLSVSSYQDGIRKVYDAGFGKPAPFYASFNYYGSKNAFTSLDSREHGLRRRRTAALYSKSALLGSHQMHNISIRVMYDRLAPRLSSAAAWGGGIDALELSYCICSDYISAFLFGYGNGTNYLTEDQKRINEWRLHYENHMCHESFFPQEMPFAYGLLKTIGIDLLPKRYGESKNFLERWMGNMALKADETIRQHRDMDQLMAPEDRPVVYETAKSAVEKDSPHLDAKAKHDEVASEMFDHISASREVLGLVLAYTFWYLAQHPYAQKRLRDELTASGIDMTSRPTPAADVSTNLSGSIPTALDKVKYLDAVINESLRMRPTSTPLPRTTPPDRCVSLMGVDNIPPGTRVNAFQWFVHRDPRKWDRVDDWIPERWLGRDESGKKGGREDVLWAFASGPRVCLGTNWTFYAMRYILAAVFSQFEFEALNRNTGDCWPGSPEDLLPVKVKILSSS